MIKSGSSAYKAEDGFDAPGKLSKSNGFARDIYNGLSRNPKSIPSMYLYDAIGSALFDAICELDEYNCTRGEKRLLREHAQEIFAFIPDEVILAELGGGNGRKASILLNEIHNRQDRIVFHSIDTSVDFLIASKNEVARYDNVVVYTHALSFLDGLKMVSSLRPKDCSLVLLFLGSSIGNFEWLPAIQLLKKMHELLLPGDFLLLGTDLIKRQDILLLAYDDPQGVTSAFNKNLLSRINRELQADFDLSKFSHRARWHSEQRRIEMHLISDIDQIVTIPEVGLLVPFEKGETILTEYSHKFKLDEIEPWVSAAGFSLIGQWIESGSQFAVNLLKAD